MNKIIPLLLITYSLNSYSEIYVCTQELSRFDRPGETETTIYKRIGNQFEVKTISKDIMDIMFESSNYLLISELTNYSGKPHLSINFIDKETKEYGQDFISMENFRREKPFPLTYGKCTLVD